MAGDKYHDDAMKRWQYQALSADKGHRIPIISRYLLGTTD